MHTSPSHYRFPHTSPHSRPASWWYVGWVLYANRMTILKAFVGFALTGIICFTSGWLLHLPLLQSAAYLLAVLGLLLLVNTLVGLTLVYGPPAHYYLQQLLKLGHVHQPQRVADLHIGTYRVSYLLHDLLPSATIESVDIWDDARYETEPTLHMLRTLEVRPVDTARLRCSQALDQHLPLPDSSCEVVVLGLGFHEIPAGLLRDQILAEAKRILQPNGTLLFFEHTVDMQSLLVFGPDIAHWVGRSEWRKLLQKHFGPQIQFQRSPFAIDLFMARCKKETGQQ